MAREQERTLVSLGIILEWSSSRRNARISDISLGGCFIDCLTPIPHGEIISFRLSVSESESVEFFGEVRYVCHGLGFGVKFVGLDDAHRSLVEHLILMHNGNPWGKDREPAECLVAD